MNRRFLTMIWTPILVCGLAMSSWGAEASDTEEIPEKSTPYGGKPHVIPGLIEAEHYDEGAPGVAYYDVDEVNHGADYRENTQVDIEERSDASNGYGIGWTRTGEWLNYTVEVKEAGTYRVEFPVASRRKGGIFRLEMDGKDVTGPIRVPDTGGWDKLKMIYAEDVELEAGEFVLRMVMVEEGPSGSIGDIDYMRFVKVETLDDDGEKEKE